VTLPIRQAVVADSTALVRAGLMATLTAAGVGAFEVARSNELFGTLHEAELVIIGTLADTRLVDVVRRIKILHKRLPVVVLMNLATREELVELLALGTDAILLRSISTVELVLALEQVTRHEVVIAPALQSSLGVDSISNPVPEDAGALTAREREVLGLLAEGRSNREIASALFVTLATVKTHLAHIYEKLGASNRNEALSHAVRSGLLT
jgi:DNA-binding NarL/FixJ family response regulator